MINFESANNEKYKVSGIKYYSVFKKMLCCSDSFFEILLYFIRMNILEIKC